MDEQAKIEEIVQKAYRYCSRGEKCASDVRKYLKTYDLSESQVQLILNKLESEKFIDPDRYVKAFVNDKFKFNKWGKLKIINELRVKNFDNNIINVHINNIDNDEYISVLTQLLKNKSKQIKNKDEYSKKASLVRFALSRGFEYESIEKCLKSI